MKLERLARSSAYALANAQAAYCVSSSALVPLVPPGPPALLALLASTLQSTPFLLRTPASTAPPTTTTNLIRLHIAWLAVLPTETRTALQTAAERRSSLDIESLATRTPPSHWDLGLGLGKNQERKEAPVFAVFAPTPNTQLAELARNSSSATCNSNSHAPRQTLVKSLLNYRTSNFQ
jgi:hypothetical protein